MHVAFELTDLFMLSFSCCWTRDLVKVAMNWMKLEGVTTKDWDWSLHFLMALCTTLWIFTQAVATSQLTT